MTYFVPSATCPQQLARWNTRRRYSRETGPVSPLADSQLNLASIPGRGPLQTAKRSNIWMHKSLLSVKVERRKYRHLIEGIRLTPEQLQSHIAQHSQRIAKKVGLNQEDLCSEASLKIIQRDEWRVHPNPEAHCTVAIRTTAIDMCRRRQRENDQLEAYAQGLAATEVGSDVNRQSETSSVNDSPEGFAEVDLEVHNSSTDTNNVDTHEIEVEANLDSAGAASDVSSEIPQNPFADVVDRLIQVDWGDSSLAPYCMLDGRILLAKKLQKLTDDQLRHVGRSLNDELTRVQMIEQCFPWDAQISAMEIGTPAVALEAAWEALNDLIVQSAIYARASRREKEKLPKANLSAVLIVKVFQSAGFEIRPNTWTANCVRAWKLVKNQFPEIAADLKPHSRGQKND